MTQTSSLENFTRMMRGEKPERLPLDIWVTPPAQDLIEKHTGTRDPVEAFDTDFVGLGIEFPVEAERWRAAYERIGFTLPAGSEVGAIGYVSTVPSRESLGAAYHLREMLHPLSAIQSAEQLPGLPWPDLTDARLFAHLPDTIARIHARGKVAVGWMACTSFEAAWYQRGMDNLFYDLIEGNGIGDWLLDWFTERSIRVAEAYCRAGIDVVLLGDDVATQLNLMMSIDFWRQHLKPRLRRVVDAIRNARRERVWVFYHSDGNVRELIPDLIEIGIDILNPVQPESMPPREVIPAHQHQLAFWGMIGTQTTMPFGTPAEVRAAVAELAELARHGARIIVAPTHVLEPDVPWANIRALVDAVKTARL